MRLLGIGFFAFTLMACSAKEVDKTFTKTTEETGYKMEEKVKLFGTDDDYLNKTESELIITFPNPDTLESDIAVIKDEFESLKNTATKYVTYDIKEENDVLKIKEVVDYEKARNDKAMVFSSELLTSDEYYSFSKTVKEFETTGYKEVTKK